jgi:type I restriction enzyme S subunit
MKAGAIPEDWRSSTIGGEADLITGFPFPSEGFARAGVRLLRGSNVKRGVIDWGDDITEFWPSVTPKIQRYELEDGDVVIAMDGALVGRSYAVLAGQDLPALLVQRVARLRSRSADLGLLGAWIASENFVRHVDSVKTHTAIPHISPRDIREFALPLPTRRNEQHAIAMAFSDVDALLGGLERLVAKKRDLKQAVMQQLLTGQTRLPSFHGEWDVKRLGETGTWLKGSGVKKDEANSGDLPCIRYGEIYTHHNDYIRSFNSWISSSVAATAARLRQGDLLFAGSGETKEEIGKCVAFLDDCAAFAGGDILILRLASGNPVFMGYYCNTAPINAQKASKAQGDAVVHISAAALSSVEVRLPSNDEQVAIGAVLYDMDAELAALAALRDKTRDIKQAMMQELLTGKTRLVSAGGAHA